MKKKKYFVRNVLGNNFNDPIKWNIFLSLKKYKVRWTIWKFNWRKCHQQWWCNGIWQYVHLYSCLAGILFSCHLISSGISMRIYYCALRGIYASGSCLFFAQSTWNGWNKNRLRNSSTFNFFLLSSFMEGRVWNFL